MPRYNYITYIYMLIVFMNYSAGFVIIKHNSSQVTDLPRTKFETAVNIKLAMHDAVTKLKNKTRNSLLECFIYNSISFLSNLNTSGTPRHKSGTIVCEKKLRTRRFNSNSNDTAQIQSYLKTSGLPIVDLASIFLDSDKNLTKPLIHVSYEGKELILDESTNYPKINTTAVFPLIPECEFGDGNCTRCRDISPFCHYMNSEERCVYFSHVHASKLYECGVRWFPVDQNEVLFATAGVLLAVTLGVIVCLIWLRIHSKLKVEDDICPVLYAESRSVVQMIREKRLKENTSDDSRLDSENI